MTIGAMFVEACDERAKMNASRQESGSAKISRFRAVVVAALRAKQLRRGSKPRIESNPGRHKDIRTAMEEVSRGLINFTRFPVAHGHALSAMSDVKQVSKGPLIFR